MGHVAVFGYYFEALDGFFVADDVVEEDGAVFLDPGGSVSLGAGDCGRWFVVRTMVVRRLGELKLFA